MTSSLKTACHAGRSKTSPYNPVTALHHPSRLRILSDLHLNNRGWQAPTVPADLVILAGDISNGTAGLRWARENFPDMPIVYVSGNQELYGHNIEDLVPRMRDLAKQLDIHFLERDVVYLNDLRILGTTLWTDFDLFGQSARWMAINKPSSARAPGPQGYFYKQGPRDTAQENQVARSQCRLAAKRAGTGI